MRRTIAVKIFSIALLLLMLMVVVAAASIYSVRGVRDEMSEIAECYTPVSQGMSRINVYALEQELHRERLLDLGEGQPSGGDALSEQRLFDKKSQKVAQEIQEAEKTVERCAAGSKPIIELSEL